MSANGQSVHGIPRQVVNGKGNRPTDPLDPVQRRHYLEALKMLRELGGERALAEHATRIMHETNEHIELTEQEVAA